MSKIFITLLLVFSTAIYADTQIKGVYGDDDRRDIYDEFNAEYVEYSRSVAAQIKPERLFSEGKTHYSLFGTTMEMSGVCSDARFAKQIQVADCTGFLVGEDLLVTAGHCIMDKYDCSRYKWVFGVKSVKNQRAVRVRKSDVYSCSEVVARRYFGKSKTDYALIRLNRRVLDRPYLKVRTEGRVEERAPLLVIGHPDGIPLKIADGGWVRENDASSYFISNLDTFSGNSGSPVINSETGLVEGILVAGDIDYVRSKKGCLVPKVCDELLCKGERVTRITQISALMKNLRNR